MAERSYFSPKVRGSDQEGQAVTAQEQSRGATPHPRSGEAAETSYPTSEVRGSNREKQPHIQEMSAWVQEGGEELHHVQSQEGWP